MYPLAHARVRPPATAFQVLVGIHRFGGEGKNGFRKGLCTEVIAGDGWMGAWDYQVRFRGTFFGAVGTLIGVTPLWCGPT